MDKGRKTKAAASGPVTTDPRFAAIHTDPRFARPKRKDVKVPLDSRFKAAFKDREFIDQRMSNTHFEGSNIQRVWTDMVESWPKMKGNEW
jgi:hypothetical protein